MLSCKRREVRSEQSGLGELTGSLGTYRPRGVAVNRERPGAVHSGRLHFVPLVVVVGSVRLDLPDAAFTKLKLQQQTSP